MILIAGVPSSQALPGFLITAPPSVCVPEVIGVVAVWISNQKKKQSPSWVPAVLGALAVWRQNQKKQNKKEINNMSW